MYQILYNDRTDIRVNQDIMIIDQVDHIAYHKTVWIEAGATLRYCLIGDASKIVLDIKHLWVGAKSSVSSVLMSCSGTSDHYKIISHLESPQTKSDVIMTTLLYAGSQTVVDGMIVVSPWATKANWYLHEHNIVLWSPVIIHTLPQLDIRHHDISAWHGATIDTINDHSLFYMMSKGIDRKHATQLILSGVVESALSWYMVDKLLTSFKHKLLTSIFTKL